MKNPSLIVVLVAVVAGACGKQENAGGGGGTASSSGAASATAPAVVPDAAAVPAVRADVTAFVALFDPIHGRLDHVARARSGCEQRPALLAAVKAIDKNTPPAGRDAAAWLAAVEKLQVAVDETGEPCDQGNIKGIEAKLDEAKLALDALTRGPS